MRIIKMEYFKGVRSSDVVLYMRVCFTNIKELALEIYPCSLFQGRSKEREN